MGEIDPATMALLDEAPRFLAEHGRPDLAVVVNALRASYERSRASSSETAALRARLDEAHANWCAGDPGSADDAIEIARAALDRLAAVEALAAEWETKADNEGGPLADGIYWAAEQLRAALRGERSGG